MQPKYKIILLFIFTNDAVFYWLVKLPDCRREGVCLKKKKVQPLIRWCKVSKQGGLVVTNPSELTHFYFKIWPFSKQRASLCYRNCLPATDSVCLSQQFIVCHSQPLSVTESLCMSQSTLFCHRKSLYVTVKLQQEIWLCRA